MVVTSVVDESTDEIVSIDFTDPLSQEELDEGAFQRALARALRDLNAGRSLERPRRQRPPNNEYVAQSSTDPHVHYLVDMPDPPDPRTASCTCTFSHIREREVPTPVGYCRHVARAYLFAIFPDQQEGSSRGKKARNNAKGN